MRAFIDRLVARAAASEPVWRLLEQTVLRVTRFAEIERRKYERSRDEAAIHTAVQAVCPDLVVKHGPFAGLKYPDAEAVRSTLFPKLLGSYERELHPVLETICKTRYTDIIDVGCAEGYYAVGLARRIPSATVVACDPNPRARERCARLAEENGVSDRVSVRAHFDAAALAAFPFSGRALVISDCEGYERHLFSPEAVRALAQHDVLVELHDFKDIELSSVLRTRFEGTHVISAVHSLDDITKAHTYRYEELGDYDLATWHLLLGEHRTAIMEWYFMTPRTQP